MCYLAASQPQEALSLASKAVTAYCPPPAGYREELCRRLAGRGMIPASGGSGEGAEQQARVVRGGEAMAALFDRIGAAAASGSATSSVVGGDSVTPAGLQRMIHVVVLWAGMEFLNSISAKQGFKIGGQDHVEMQPAVLAVLRFCQLLLDIDPRCSFAYKQAAGVMSYLLETNTPQRLPHSWALLERGIAVAKQTDCECWLQQSGTQAGLHRGTRWPAAGCRRMLVLAWHARHPHILQLLATARVITGRPAFKFALCCLLCCAVLHCAALCCTVLCCALQAPWPRQTSW